MVTLKLTREPPPLKAAQSLPTEQVTKNWELCRYQWFIRARVFLGDCYYSLQDYEKAAAHYEMALRLGPDDDQARRFLFDTYTRWGPERLGVEAKFRKGDLVARSRDLLAAMGDRRDDARGLYQIALTYLARKLTMPARFYFDLALKLARNDAGLVIDALRGKALASQGSPDDPDRFSQVVIFALEDDAFRAAFTQNPAATLETYGFILGDELKTQLLLVDISLVQRALARLPRGDELPSSNVGPEQERAALEAAKRSYALRDWEGAIAQARLAIQIDPNRGANYLLAGLIHIGLEEYDLAIAHFKEATLRGESAPWLYCAIGCLFLIEGDQQAALIALSEAETKERGIIGPKQLEEWRERLSQVLNKRTQIDRNEYKEWYNTLSRDKQEPPLHIALSELIRSLNLTGTRRYVDCIASLRKGADSFLRYLQLIIVADGLKKGQRIHAQLLTEISSSDVRPIARASSRAGKIRALDAVPADRRRHLSEALGAASLNFLREGDQQVAMLYAELALKNARLIPNDPPPDGFAVKKYYIAHAYGALSNLQLVNGRYLECLDALKLAESGYVGSEADRKRLGLPKSLDADSVYELMRVIEMQAGVYGELGRPNERRTAEFKAIEIAISADSARAKIHAYSKICYTYEIQGYYDEALHHYNRAFQLLSAGTGPRGFFDRRTLGVEVANRLGFALNKMGLHKLSMVYFTMALRDNQAGVNKIVVGDQGRPKMFVVMSHRNVAMAYEHLGDRKKALEHLAQALHLATAGRGDDPDAPLGADDTIDPSLAWDVLARLGRLHRQHAAATEPPVRITGLELALRRYRQALSVIETTRRKQRADQLLVEETARVGYTGDKASVYRDAFELVRELDAAAPGKGYEREMLECAERAKSQSLVELLRERRLTADPHQSPGSSSAAAFLDALAARKTHVLEYYFTDRAAYVLCFGGGARTLLISELRDGDKPLAPDELERRAMRLRALLSDLAKPLDEIKKESEALYRVLFPGAVREALREATDLVIVPHGSLHLLPIPALWDGQGYLYRSKRVTLAPSAGVLLYTMERQRAAPQRGQVGGASGGPALLSVINPAGSASLRFISEQQEGDLPRIFHSPPSQYYAPGAGPGTRPSAEMTRDRFLAEAGRFDYLHVYSHAVFLPGDPLNSYIDLANGPLKAADLYEAIGADHKFEIRARLVTLAACETGEGRVASGDEVLGLPRALLHAGATSMLVTLWRADAYFTDRLMVRLYKKLKLRETPGGAAEALREALDETIAHGKEEGYEHPFYWAPFALMGDPQ